MAATREPGGTAADSDGRNGGSGGATSTGTAGSGGVIAPLAGAGGSSPNGSPATDITVARPGDACTQAGQHACDGHASRQRLRCDGQTWQVAEQCPELSRCETRTGPFAAECRPVFMACADRLPGDTVCVDSTQLGTCGPDLLSVMPTTACTDVTPVCEAAACTCSEPCDGMCRDHTSDPSHCGGCGRICDAGVCSAGLCDPTQVISGHEYGGLTADDTGLYWHDFENSRLMKQRANGSRLTLAENVHARAFVIDRTRAYTTTSQGIISVPRDGGSISTLVAGASFSAVAQNAGNLVYWDGTALQLLSKNGGSPRSLVPVTDEVYGIAVDDTNAYWTARGRSDIQMVSLSGGSPRSLVAGLTEPNDLLLVADSLYYTARSGLGRVDLDQGTSEVLEGWSFRLATDGAHVYTSTGTGGYLMRLSLAGADGFEALTPSRTAIYDVTVDDEFVYWHETISGTTCPCRIMKLRK